MKVLCRFSGALALAFTFAFTVACQRVETPVGNMTVIEGGTLIDGTGRPPVSNAVIVIEGNILKAIGAKGSVEVPASAKKIDATGKWVLPGLIDGHSHYREYLPELLINYGTTSLINTGDYMDYILNVREATASGKLWGPRIFTTGAGITGAAQGAMRDRMVVHNAAEARAAAEEHVRRKVDLIKLYGGVTSEEVKAITEVAHTAGIKVTGHIELIDAREAVAAGIDGLEHASGISAALVPESDAKEIKSGAPGPGWRTGGGIWHYKMDESKFDDLVQLLVSRNVRLTPTLVYSTKGIFKQWERIKRENSLLLNNPNLAYVPRESAERWLSTASIDKETPQDREHRRIGYEKMTRFLKKFVDAGGILIAGSDFVGSATPGTALHDEMWVFVEDVGLTPMQAIQTATRNPAEFYFEGKGLGTLELGKLADLIIVKDDPLQDIRNTRQIELVMKDGRVMELGYHADYKNPYRMPDPKPGERPPPR